MREGGYGLGIDVGDRSVRAAVVRGPDGPAESLEPPRDVLPDAGGLLPRHVMARVGGPTPVFVGEHPVTAARLVADAVAAVVAAATAREGTGPAWTVLAVPPSWGGHRRAELAAALAGTPAVSVASSAVAVARHHRGTPGLPLAPLVAVFDLGASSLDTAVVRTAASGDPEHAAVPPPPLAWGGRDVDDALLTLLAGFAGPDPAGAAEEPAGVTAGELRRRATAAKESLSADTAVMVASSVPGAGAVRLVREDLEEAVAPSLGTAVATLRTAVADAGFEISDLDGVLLAGGGARMPLVAEVLSATLGRPLFVSPDPVRTAASGAAALAWDRAAAGADSADSPATDAETGAGDAAAAGSSARRRHLVRAAVSGRPAARTRGTAPTGARRAVQRGATVLGLALVLLLLPTLIVTTVEGRVARIDSPAVAAADEPVAPSPAAVAATAQTAADTAAATAQGSSGTAAGSRVRTGPASTSAVPAGRRAGTAAKTQAKIPVKAVAKAPGTTASTPARVQPVAASAGSAGPAAVAPGTAPAPPVTTPDPGASSPPPAGTPPATTDPAPPPSGTGAGTGTGTGTGDPGSTGSGTAPPPATTGTTVPPSGGGA